jgi:outer membrane protein OmpA-like peptidoglycan-associated protein
MAELKQPRQEVITLSGSVLFRSDDAALLPSAERKLDQVAEVLRRAPDKSVVVEGFTDSRGSRAYNRRLSHARAESVRQYFISKGVPRERIEARGLGADLPVADNGTPEGRANNRRVEVLLEPANAGPAGQVAPTPSASGRRPPPSR